MVVYFVIPVVLKIEFWPKTDSTDFGNIGIGIHNFNLLLAWIDRLLYIYYKHNVNLFKPSNIINVLLCENNLYLDNMIKNKYSTYYIFLRITIIKHISLSFKNVSTINNEKFSHTIKPGFNKNQKRLNMAHSHNFPRKPDNGQTLVD